MGYIYTVGERLDGRGTLVEYRLFAPVNSVHVRIKKGEVGTEMSKAYRHIRYKIL